MNWLDYDIEQSVMDYEFTKAAVQKLNRVISSDDFNQMDAKKIFDYLSGEMKIVLFNDYLKRYIYEKAEIPDPFNSVPDELYKEIIISSFRDNRAPFTFKNPDRSSVVKTWLNRESTTRDNIFALGFGLKMSDADVSEFLTKVLLEDDFDLFDPEEVVYWYCFRHGYSYAKAMNFLQSGSVSAPVSWDVIKGNPKMYLLTDFQLSSWLTLLRKHHQEQEETRMEVFNSLYEYTKKIISDIYQEYRPGEGKDSSKVTPADVEKIICCGIPTNQKGNLEKMSVSILSKQFRGKRFDRQRISRIFAGKISPDRFDLITLLFFIYAEEVEPDWPVERYLRFIDEANEILGKCNMMGLYPVNPYESFVLMCLVTDGPMDVYTEVLEQSFDL